MSCRINPVFLRRFYKSPYLVFTCLCLASLSTDSDCKDVSTRIIVEILLGATEAIVNPTRMAELDLTPRQGFSTITAVILEGMLTDKGRGKQQTRRQGEGESRS